MASPAESKVDENEVTSHHHHRRQEEEEDAEVELGFAATRQSSFYSLTLDEIQNTVCEPGKDFSSMNMGEFLSNIWNVEEAGFDVDAGGVNLNAPAPAGLPLARQGSISVPAPLCRKTVDEVWAEIHREEEEGEHFAGDRQSDVDRQPTMGEMTLEDFLVKAGVVRECFAPNDLPPPPPQPPHHNFGGMVSYPDHAAGLEYYQYQPQEQQVAEGHGASASGKGHRLRLGSAASPVSSDGGMGTGHVDNGRKRTTDGGGGGGGGGGVERRQRRMIKNRESAARSRARKQAYTVELEAELNLLKEDNARLRGEEAAVPEEDCSCGNLGYSEDLAPARPWFQ